MDRKPKRAKVGIGKWPLCLGQCFILQCCRTYNKPKNGRKLVTRTTRYIILYNIILYNIIEIIPPYLAARPRLPLFEAAMTTETKGVASGFPAPYDHFKTCLGTSLGEDWSYGFLTIFGVILVVLSRQIQSHLIGLQKRTDGPPTFLSADGRSKIIKHSGGGSVCLTNTYPYR